MISGMHTYKRKCQVEEEFYGLNQAPRMSYENICNVLFTKCFKNRRAFYSNGVITIIILYDDDILVSITK